MRYIRVYSKSGNGKSGFTAYNNIKSNVYIVLSGRKLRYISAVFRDIELKFLVQVNLTIFLKASYVAFV